MIFLEFTNVEGSWRFMAKVEIHSKLCFDCKQLLQEKFLLHQREISFLTSSQNLTRE